MNKKIIILTLILVPAILAGCIFWFIKKHGENNKEASQEEVASQESEKINNKEEVAKNRDEDVKKEVEMEAKQSDILIEGGELDIKKIDISDWVNYRNEKYGFEIKYPKRLICKEQDVKNNNPSLSVEEYYYVYFYPNLEDVKKSFLCGTALYVDIHNLPIENIKLEDLIEAKNEWNGDLLPKYKFNDNKKISLNDREFIFADAMPYFLSAVIIKNDKYYIIHIGSDIGGSVISKDCEDIYMNFLNSFNFI